MKTNQDPDPCDYCGQRPAAFPVAGVILCRECYAHILSNERKNPFESDEQTPEEEF
jgi:hypothetical protein